MLLRPTNNSQSRYYRHFRYYSLSRMHYPHVSPPLKVITAEITDRGPAFYARCFCVHFSTFARLIFSRFILSKCAFDKSCRSFQFILRVEMHCSRLFSITDASEPFDKACRRCKNMDRSLCTFFVLSPKKHKKSTSSCSSEGIPSKQSQGSQFCNRSLENAHSTTPPQQTTHPPLH